MAIRIKRENWKGRYVVVAREKGKIRSWGLWKKGKFKYFYTSRYKNQGSFRKDYYRTELTNVREITDYSSTRKPPRNRPYQYVMSGYIGKEKVTARSMKKDDISELQEARDECEESFYERIALAKGKAYDADEGRKFSEQIKHFKEGIVWYEEIS